MERNDRVTAVEDQKTGYTVFLVGEKKVLGYKKFAEDRHVFIRAGRPACTVKSWNQAFRLINTVLELEGGNLEVFLLDEHAWRVS